MTVGDRVARPDSPLKRTTDVLTSWLL